MGTETNPATKESRALGTRTVKNLALERRRLEAKTALPFMATRAVTTAHVAVLHGSPAAPLPRLSRSSRDSLNKLWHVA